MQQSNAATNNHQDEFSHKAETWDDNPRRIKQANLFVQKITDTLLLSKEETIMDFGCGTGLVGLQLIPYAKQLIMADKSPSMLKVLQKKIANRKIKASKIKLFAGDIAQLNPNSISLVVSLMTFHHIENITAIIENLYRVLMPGGRIVIGDLAKEDGSFHNSQVPHKGFDQQSLCENLSKVGFKLSLCEIFNKLHKEIFGENRNFEQFIIIAEK